MFTIFVYEKDGLLITIEVLMELEQMFSNKEIEVINYMCIYWLEKYFEYHEP